MTLVTFTGIELLGCYDLARQRNTKRPGVASRKMFDAANDLITNYVAVKAEYAVEKLAGVPMNYTVTPSGWRLLPHEADDVLAAWRAVIAAPVTPPQPRLFDLADVA